MEFTCISGTSGDKVKVSIDDLHKAFESRVRLGIMSALAVNDRLDFTSLREYLDVTDGNLATHIKTLEKEGFIGVEKSFIDRKPNTRYYMTDEGKKAFDNHLKALEEIIKLQKSE
jgi:DNA-binding MarR family transcriptional regulator